MDSTNSRALVVEDDPSLSQIFARFLVGHGWNTDSAPSVAAALRLFESRCYDIALCDIELPDGSGVALAEALRKLNPTLRIVITSGNPMELDRAKKSGFAHCLQKPFDLDALHVFLAGAGIPK